MTYDDIIDLMGKNKIYVGEFNHLNENNYISIWEPFENHKPSWVAEQIDLVRESLEINFIERV